MQIIFTTMLKKILIVVAVLVAILAGAMIYLNHRNRTLSPPGSAELTAGDLTVRVDYSRPSVRNRLIFGSKEEGALQPYGVYWRLGANEATKISFDKDVLFNGEPVAAGTYSMYAIPGPGQFDIGINSESEKWGHAEPDHTRDVLHTKVPVTRITPPVEQFTIGLDDSGNGVRMTFEWEDVSFVVPVEPQ